MEKRWVQAVKGNQESADLLAQQLTIDRSLAEILVQRGIDSFKIVDCSTHIPHLVAGKGAVETDSVV